MNFMLPNTEECRVKVQTEKLWEDSNSDIKAGLHSVTIARINFMPESTLVKHYVCLSAEHIKINSRNTSKLIKVGMPLSSIYHSPESFTQQGHIIPNHH